MQSSSLSLPHNSLHEPRFFNAQTRLLLSKKQVKCQKLNSNSDASRPCIVIVAEKFYPEHAMYRCYAPSIQGMRKNFSVKLIVEKQIPLTVSELADQVLFEDFHPENLGNIVKVIQSLQPNIVFFPSVGMTPATLALANLRMAAQQFVGIGHPSPIGSDCIDGMIALQDCISIQGTWLETPVPIEQHPILLSLYQTQAFELVATKANKRPTVKSVKLGINAAHMKLNAEFLTAIQQIVAFSQQPIEMKFFPNLSGLHHLAFAHRLKTLFPTAEVFTRTGYNTYITQLADCDLVLQSFPFGGTNTAHVGNCVEDLMS